MTFSIPGFGPDYLVPRAAINLIWGAGSISAGSQPFALLLVGMKTSDGSMTADVDVKQFFTDADADTLAGKRSQLGRMIRKALKLGVPIFGAAVADPAGTAATVTLTLGGTSTASGQWGIRIGGQLITGPIANNEAHDTTGANMETVINAFDGGRLPFSASYNAGTDVLTLTCANTGAQSNDWIVAFDRTYWPSGLTATLAGSTTINSNADRVRAGAVLGAGIEDVTNILTKITSKRYARIGAAQYDTGTNAAKWVAFAVQQSGPMVLKIDQIVMAMNAAYSTAQTLAASTLNAPLIDVIWHRNSEAHPAEIAAVAAAARVLEEAGNPLTDFDGYVLPGIPAQVDDADLPSDAEQNTALQHGVCVVTSSGTNARIVRGITSHCISNTLADRRTIDWGDVTIPERAVYEFLGLWDGFKAANPIVADNPPPEEQALESGIGTPAMWDQTKSHLLGNADWRKWIETPKPGDISSYFDTTSKRICGTDFLTPRRLNHQLQEQVLQATSA